MCLREREDIILNFEKSQIIVYLSRYFYCETVGKTLTVWFSLNSYVQRAGTQNLSTFGWDNPEISPQILLFLPRLKTLHRTSMFFWEEYLKKLAEHQIPFYPQTPWR
jgi:hypothetical protein